MFPYCICMGMINILNERCSKIFNKILNNKSPITIEELSNLLGVSSRTIRYDLDNIDNYLKEHDLKILTRKPNKGISFTVPKEEKQKILEIFRDTDNNYYIMSQTERVLNIFYILLGLNEYITIQKLSDLLKVSKATVQNDMKLLKSYINTKTEYIETVKGKGIRLVGNETKLRQIASKKLLAHLSHNEANVDLFRLFSDISVLSIQNFVREAEKQMNTVFSEDKFNNLVIHLIIAIKRIKTGKDILMDSMELKHLSNTPEFAIVSSITNSLEKQFNIEIPKSEIGYITIHLLGNNFFNENVKNELYLQKIVIILIEKTSKLYEFPFEYDNGLYDNLLQHMQSFIYRVQHNILIKNPLLAEIKNKYSDLFLCIKQVVQFLDDEYKITVNDEECGYLCIHFMTSYERMKHCKEHKARVLLVCATGIGTSKYVLNKLQSMFDFETVGTTSLHNAYEYIVNESLDLVITTVPLQSVPVKSILVQPFLTEKNISEISAFFAKYNYNKPIKNKKSLPINDIMNLVEKYYRIDNKNMLKQNLMNLLQEYSIQKLSFMDLLGKDRIVVQADIASWQEAISLGGKLLKDEGYIEENYIKDMIDNVNNFGEYMILAPKIVMPHASMKDNVNKTGFSLVITKEPVEFGKSKNKAQIFITLAAVDKEQHTQALKEIMYLLDDDEIIYSILQSTTKEEIEYILKTNIKKYLDNQ